MKSSVGKIKEKKEGCQSGFLKQDKEVLVADISIQDANKYSLYVIIFCNNHIGSHEHSHNKKNVFIR